MLAKSLTRFQTFLSVHHKKKNNEIFDKYVDSNRGRKLYLTSELISVFASAAVVASKGALLR